MLEPITTQPDSIRVLVDSVGFVIYQHAADTVVVSLKSNLIDSVLVALNHKLNDASISPKDWLIAITSIVAGITSGLIVVII